MSVLTCVCRWIDTKSVCWMVHRHQRMRLLQRCNRCWMWMLAQVRVAVSICFLIVFFVLLCFYASVRFVFWWFVSSFVRFCLCVCLFVHRGEGLEDPWHGAEAYHYYLLGQRQLYTQNYDAAMKTVRFACCVVLFFRFVFSCFVLCFLVLCFLLLFSSTHVETNTGAEVSRLRRCVGPQGNLFVDCDVCFLQQTLWTVFEGFH